MPTGHRRASREFTCAVPEHLDLAPTPHVAHPGCFATAALLATRAAARLGTRRAAAVHRRRHRQHRLGPQARRGHPPSAAPRRLVRLCALAHRHAPEIAACAERASGIAAQIHFVPHSGPFARGIHITVQAVMQEPRSSAAVQAALAEYYRDRPFVRVVAAPPRVKDVATSNYAHLHAVADGTSHRRHVRAR